MNGCDECEMWRRKGAAFCPVCGSKLEKPERPIFDVLVLLGATAVAFIVLFNAVYVTANFGNICSDLDDYTMPISISFGLWDVILCRYSGIWMDIVLAAYTAIEVACVAYALWRLWTVLRERPDDYPAQEGTGMYMATAALSLSLFISIVGIALSAIVDQVPDTSWLDDYSDYVIVFMMTHAGVSEELFFRVMYIGIPMTVIALIVRRDKRSWQYLFGGFGLSKTAVVLIIVSSTLFGLAHYNGWGWSKVPLTFFGGLLFAYVYTEYGLYTSIIMHTANDTMLTLVNAGLGGLSVLAEFSLIILGLIVLIYWILHPNRKVFDLKNMETFPPKLENNLAEQWKRH